MTKNPHEAARVTDVVRAIHIIDFEYPYWHTTLDTVDKCSPRSLQIVRDVVLEVILRDETAHPPLHKPEGFRCKTKASREAQASLSAASAFSSPKAPKLALLRARQRLRPGIDSTTENMGALEAVPRRWLWGLGGNARSRTGW